MFLAFRNSKCTFLNVGLCIQFSEFTNVCSVFGISDDQTKMRVSKCVFNYVIYFFLDSWEISKKNTRNWHSTVTSVKAKLPGRLLSSHSQQTITSQQQKKISRANQKAENKCSTQQQMIIIHLIADNLHLISEDALSVLYQTIIIHLKADNLFSIPKKAHST